MQSFNRYSVTLFLLATVIAYQAYGVRNKPLKNSHKNTIQHDDPEKLYSTFTTPDTGKQQFETFQTNQHRITELEERLARAHQTLTHSQHNAQILQNQLQQSQSTTNLLRDKQTKNNNYIQELQTDLQESKTKQAQYLKNLFEKEEAEQSKIKDIELLQAKLIDQDKKLAQYYLEQSSTTAALERANLELLTANKELIMRDPDKKNIIHLQKELTACIQERNELKELTAQDNHQTQALQATCEKLSKENKQLAQLLAKTEQQIGTLNKNSRFETEETRRQHNQEMQELCAKIELIEERMHTAAQLAKDREVDIINAARVKFKEMKDEQCLLTENLEKINHNHKQITSALEEQLSKSCMQLAQAQEHMSNQQISDSSTQKKIQTLIQENVQLENLLALSENNAQDMEQRIALLHNDLLAKEETYASTKTALANLEKELKDVQPMKDQLTHLQEALEETAQYLAQSQQGYENSITENDSLRFELSDISKKWYEGQAALSCAEEEKNRHAQIASNLMHSMQDTAKQFQEKLQLAQERELTAINQGKEAMAQALQKVKDKFAHYKAYHENLQAKRIEEHAEHEKTCAVLHETQEKLLAAQNKYAQETQALTTQICALETERNYLNNTATEMAQQLQDHEIYWQNELQGALTYSQEQLEQTQTAYEAKLVHMQQKENDLRIKGKDAVRKIAALAQEKIMQLKQDQKHIKMELASAHQEKNNLLKTHMEKQLETIDTKLSLLNNQPQEKLFS